MRSPQVLIYEQDHRLAGWLREQLKELKWTCREVRSPESCLHLLRHGGPNVVVLKVGHDLKGEMRFLERSGRLYPETAAVVVSDMDNPALAALAWDLGARYVLSPPQPRDSLPAIVVALMGAASRRLQGMEGLPVSESSLSSPPPSSAS
jgi:DNA-binding response OmpR family regulator